MLTLTSPSASPSDSPSPSLSPSRSISFQLTVFDVEECITIPVVTLTIPLTSPSREPSAIALAFNLALAPDQVPAARL